MFAILSVLFAAKDAHARGCVVQLGTLGKLLLLYIAYMAIGITYSAHTLNSLATVAMWLVMLLVYVSVTTTICNRTRLNGALFLLAIIAGVIGFIACFQYLYRTVFGTTAMANQFWYPVDEFFYRYFPMSIDLDMGANRSASTFNNPNMLAEYLIMVLPLAGYYGFCGKRTAPRLITRAMIILTIFGAIISFSRGAYIALLSMLLLIIVTHLRKLTPFMMCLVAAVSLVPEAIISRFLSIGEGGHAIFERLEAWEVAMESIIGSPIFGTGPGVSNLWEFLNSMGVNAPHSHNLILQVLVEGGFIGLFLLCLIATRLLQESLGLLRRTRKTAPIGRVFILFSVAFIVHGMVDYPFLSPKMIGVFCMILGFFDAMSAMHQTTRLTPLSRVMDPILLCFRKKKKL